MPLKLAICRHIKTNGHRCQSPAITGSVFCYFHRNLRRGHDAASTAEAAPLRPETVQYLLENGQNPAQLAPAPTLNFPPLEDAESIQLAISRFAAIAAGQIDPVQARSLLYALQVASLQRPSTRSRTRVRQTTSPPWPSRVVRTRDGQTLAAPRRRKRSPSPILTAAKPSWKE